MNVEDIIKKYTSEDGTVDYAKVNKEISDNTVSKSKYDEEVEKSKGAYAAAKAKYKPKEDIQQTNNNDSNNTEQKTKEIDVDKVVDEKVNSKLTEFQKQQQADQQLAKQLEAVKPEFRKFVKHEATTSEDFNMDDYLKENKQYAAAINTQSNSVNSNMTSNNLSAEDKAINDLLEKM